MKKNPVVSWGTQTIKIEGNNGMGYIRLQDHEAILVLSQKLYTILIFLD